LESNLGIEMGKKSGASVEYEDYSSLEVSTNLIWDGMRKSQCISFVRFSLLDPVVKLDIRAGPSGSGLWPRRAPNILLFINPKN
jgi:hypothetical protein